MTANRNIIEPISIQSWLRHLRVLTPPSSVLLVGAGTGTGRLIQSLLHFDVSNVTLVEADEAKLKSLRGITSSRESWRIKNNLVSANAQIATYYEASLASESGLLDPEKLFSCWPNISCRAKQDHPTITLADLQEGLEDDANWLMVDCLPALDILQGARIEDFDVIVVRALLGEEHLGDSGASLLEIMPYLAESNYRCVASETGRHPLIGHALFVRDQHAVNRLLHRELAESREETSTLGVQLEDASIQSERRIEIISREVDQKFEELNRVQEMLDKVIADHAREIEQHTQAMIAVENLATERLHMIELLQSQLSSAADPISASRAQQIGDQIEAQIVRLIESSSKESRELRDSVNTVKNKLASTEELIVSLTSLDKVVADHARQIEQHTQARIAVENLATERLHKIELLQSQLSSAADPSSASQVEPIGNQIEAQIVRLIESTSKESRELRDSVNTVKNKLASTEELMVSLTSLDKVIADHARQIEQHTQARITVENLATERLHKIELLQSQLSSAADPSSASPMQQIGNQIEGQIVRLGESTSKESQELRDSVNAVRNKLASTEELIVSLAGSVGALNAHEVGSVLDGKFLRQTEEHNEKIKGLKSSFKDEINQGLSNVIRQLEAFINVNDYLRTGESGLQFHGWPISPDMALYLLDLMQEKKYDLVIEFGSGTSTVLLAKALSHVRKNDCIADDAGGFFTKKIISFEHDFDYHRKTAGSLKQQGLEARVNLLHAPLIDWEDGAGKFLYYDCAEPLRKMAESFKGESKRILVLVDGPPGVICKNSRYPAIPQVFAIFGKHEIDIVLDDFNRSEEKEVVDLWRGFWKRRSIAIRERILPSEKGFYFATNRDQS